MKKLILSVFLLGFAVSAFADPYAVKENSNRVVPWAQREQANLDAFDANTVFVDGAKGAKALLDGVTDAYSTDPMVLTKIGIISQAVMTPKAAKHRATWTGLLLASAKKSVKDYQTTFYLDQLRWCGLPEQAKEVRALASGRSRDIYEMSELVASTLTMTIPPPVQEKPAVQEKPVVQEKAAEQKKPVEQKKPAEQKK